MVALRVSSAEPAGERCCAPGSCLYSARSVERFVRAVRALRSAGLDVSESAGSVLNPRRGYDEQRGGGHASRYDEAKSALILADVQRAMRSARTALTVDELARSLCPWSGEESADGAL